MKSCDRVFISRLEPRCPLGITPLDIRQRHPVYLTESGDKARTGEKGIKCALSSTGMRNEGA